MLFFYTLGVWLYGLLIFLVSPFNRKAGLWIDGRRGILGKVAAATGGMGRCCWFHFASLGEFEQGRPVLEALRRRFPEKPIVVTFFSPSGYEVRRNFAGADHVFYLPPDTPGNARTFISLLNPEFAVFTKYEYWYYYFRELKRIKIPLYMISAIFRKDQPFFKGYGTLHREMLATVTGLFVQDEKSQRLLDELFRRYPRMRRPGEVIVSGDTRFDRVAENATTARNFPEIQRWIGGSPVLVCGSTWLPDEKRLAVLCANFPGWKFIVAPHETDAGRIGEILQTLGKHRVTRYSSIQETVPGETPEDKSQVLLIDTIGMLSALYRYADIAYIGGGFGSGIHNTLEAAAFGAPVIFGPNYSRFREARDLIGLAAGFSIVTSDELLQVFADLQHEPFRRAAGQKAAEYVRAHVGATDRILARIAPPENAAASAPA